jgi:cyclopropane-fatty-acyl-phospholipid synthase
MKPEVGIMFASVIEPAQLHLTKYFASKFFHRLVTEYGDCEFSVRLADGTNLASTPRSAFTLVINDPHVLEKILDSPDELTLGEAFINGDLDVEGDLGAALQFAELLMSLPPEFIRKIDRRLVGSALPFPKTAVSNRDLHLVGDIHCRERDRAAIAHHYDVSNAFYQLWLDPYLQYSAAYFSSSEQDLNAAQVRKLDHLCRKLMLKPGERFLDIGCGWGGLVMYAASHYDVEAFGITASQNQAQLAWERIRSAGLDERCAIRVCDYRDLDQSAAYDKIASIGMFEHVGESMLPLYFAQAFQLLRPGGVFLNSGIAVSATYQRQGASFIDKYVFPDGELVPLYKAVQQAEISGLEVRDVEDSGEHYALTLDRWVERLEQCAPQARKATNDATYRTWRLYMAASARAFRAGRIHLYQMLLCRPDQAAVRLESRKNNGLNEQKSIRSFQ